jgi:hypothetical protein
VRKSVWFDALPSSCVGGVCATHGSRDVGRRALMTPSFAAWGCRLLDLSAVRRVLRGRQPREES